MYIGFPFDWHNTSSSDSSPGEDTDVDISGDNNRVTVINGDNNQVINFAETSPPDNSNEDEIETDETGDNTEDKTEDKHIEGDTVGDSNMYIMSIINPETIVEQNYETIMQKKSEYTDSDISLIKSNFVYLSIYEQAGFVSFTRDENTQDATSIMTLGGEFVSSAIVIFLDYETDNIIYTLVSDEQGDVEYYPTTKNKFYYIVVSSEYELYISEPILLSEENGRPYVGTFVFLSKKYDTFSPQFQVKVNKCDTNETVQNHTILPNTDITVYFVTRATNNHESYISFHYPFDTNDSGIISFKGFPCYFQLNNRYLMDIMRFGSDPAIIDGLIKNTNIISVNIEY